MTIGNNIKTVRELQNYTQDYVAEKLGITQSAYSKIERDEVDITFSKLQKICEVLSVSLADIINLEAKNIIANNKFDNNSAVWNHITNYSIDAKLEDLYREHIELLKDKIKRLESKE
jgi:transcriptional regulator with XRE-family HTH domain